MIEASILSNSKRVIVWLLENVELDFKIMKVINNSNKVILMGLFPVEHLISIADHAYYGHVHFIKYLRSIDTEWTHMTCEAAAYAGNLG